MLPSPLLTFLFLRSFYLLDAMKFWGKTENTSCESKVYKKYESPEIAGKP